MLDQQVTLRDVDDWLKTTESGDMSPRLRHQLRQGLRRWSKRRQHLTQLSEPAKVPGGRSGGAAAEPLKPTPQ